MGKLDSEQALRLKFEYIGTAEQETKHSETEFSYGICPGCKEKLYPEIFDDEQ